MLSATTIVRRPAVKAERVVDTAWLDHHARAGGEALLTTHGGLEFALKLDRPAVLNDGDAVTLEDGRLIQVRAAPEDLAEIRAENPARLMRLAWQMGQRHTNAEITSDAIFVLNDRELTELARGQGCQVAPVRRPFHPELADEHLCDHHGHGHAGHRRDPHHHHDHGHAEHQHGPGCSHGHAHQPEH